MKKIVLISLAVVMSASATITWTQKADLIVGRDGVGVAAVDSLIYCIGGWTGGYPWTATDLVEAYNPATNTWTIKSKMPTARGFLAVCVLNGKIYALGGWNGSSDTLRTAEVYDPLTDTWDTIAPMNYGKAGLGAEVAGGKIYVMGSFHGSRDVVEEYDPATNTWTVKTSMPGARSMFASEAVNGRIYLLGGCNTHSYVVPTWEYDPAGDTTGGDPWQVKSDIPTIRNHPEAAVVAGKIYVCGGINDSEGQISIGYLGYHGRGELATVEAYDPASDTWTDETPMNFARRELDVAALGDRLYAVAGWPAGVSRINEEGLVELEVSRRESRSARTRLPAITNGPIRFDPGFRLYDASGRRIQSGPIDPGVYFLVGEGGVHKIVKIR